MKQPHEHAWKPRLVCVGLPVFNRWLNRSLSDSPVFSGPLNDSRKHASSCGDMPGFGAGGVDRVRVARCCWGIGQYPLCTPIPGVRVWISSPPPLRFFFRFFCCVEVS
jgi:hypothetical protein